MLGFRTVAVASNFKRYFASILKFPINLLIELSLTNTVPWQKWQKFKILLTDSVHILKHIFPRCK